MYTLLNTSVPAEKSLTDHLLSSWTRSIAVKGDAPVVLLVDGCCAYPTLNKLLKPFRLAQTWVGRLLTLYTVPYITKATWVAVYLFRILNCILNDSNCSALPLLLDPRPLSPRPGLEAST